MSKLSKQLVTLARQGGGSFKTVADRSRIASRFPARLAALNIQIRDINHIKTKHIIGYVNSRLAENISKRTLQNEMSAIRSLLSVAGRTTLADPHHPQLSNEALNIGRASREGTKVAIPDEKLQAVISLVSEKDKGVMLAVQLSRYLGLRTEETVQSSKSLKRWKQSVLKGDERVRVVFGTKGGRPRDTTVVQREKIIGVLNAAIKYCDENNGRLIDKSTLHAAIDRYRNIVREAGLTGKYAPHSLRYAYAREAAIYHAEKGMSEEEARAMVSMDLGHGDGRGDYVVRVYNKVDPE
jgi:site-specific recombinase XerD